MKLSILIPVYNEESTIGEVIEQLLSVKLPGVEKEIIVIDDGSTDGTADVLKQEQRKNADVVTVYSSRRNFGKGMAIRIGLKYASGEIILIQDADLELDPKEVGRLLEPILSGRASVVYGSRFSGGTNRIPWKSRLAQRILTPLTRVLYGAHLTDEATAYKVFKAEILKEIALHCTGFEFCPEVTAKLLKRGHAITEVSISYQPRTRVEGKKLLFLRDGVTAVYTLLKYRFLND
ncbi:MAG: glycosyltransferase family 2 protein [Nitrospirae bacterium]|nr:glycosyltransferase family 2 protein [Candidatus Manganitrophaceae bacterium]